jgi:chromosome segregation ATPase
MAVNRDEILLERLQTTIDTWNTEVTAAQESLAQQIGDARTQLHTLIGALNRRSHSNGHGDASAIRGQVPAERDAALREALERNRNLETALRRIEEERRAPPRELTKAREEIEELRGQIAAYQAQEREAASLIERAEKELAAMRRSLDAATTGRQTAIEEVQRLREAGDIAAREHEGFEAESRRLRGQLADRLTVNRQLEAEIESLTAIVDSLKPELDAARTAGPAKIAELEAELQRLIARGQEREIAFEAAMREAEELRRTEQDRGQIEAELRAEAQSLRNTVETLRRSGEELDGDLASLKAEYDRQAETLAETVREIQAHWEIERQGEERERQLHSSLSELQRLYSVAQSELANLRVSAALAVSGTIEDQAADGRKEESEGLQRLLAFEQILIEREEVVEAASERMRRLEETAVRLQAEVAGLQMRREAGSAAQTDGRAFEAARSENARLRGGVADLERINADQAERVIVLEGQIRQLRRELDAPARRETAAAFVTSAPALEAAAAVRQAFAAHDAAGQKKSMGEILVDAGIISGQQLESALEEQRTAKKRRLGSILVEKGLIREEIVAQVVAAQLNLPFVRLSETPIQRGAVALLDGRLATHHMCFPIAATSAEATIAMANPLDLIAIEDLEFATHLKIRPVVATLSDITSAIVENYGVTIANAIAEDTFDVQSPVRKPAQGPFTRDF